MFITAQIFGVLALIACVLQFLAKNKKIYIIFGIAINLFLGIEYMFLGTFSGAYLCLFAAFKYVIYLLKGKNKFFSGIYIPVFFVVCNVIISALTFKNWYDILPAISAVSVCIYPWSENIKLIKICTLLIGPLWITYDILVSAWVSMIMEIVALVAEFAIFVTLLYKEHRQKQKAQSQIEQNSNQKIIVQNNEQST